VKFAAWAESILSKLSDAQIQRMLATEFGAMNEMMIDLYADTGDKRWLKAEVFDDPGAAIVATNGPTVISNAPPVFLDFSTDF